MASGETLAVCGLMPSRLSAKHDILPTTMTAGQACEDAEFAAVAVGCEACAEAACSEAIRLAAAEGAAVWAEATAAEPRQMLLPRATAVARRAEARRRTVNLTAGIPLSVGAAGTGVRSAALSWPEQPGARGIAAARDREGPAVLRGWDGPTEAGVVRVVVRVGVQPRSDRALFFELWVRKTPGRARANGVSGVAFVTTLPGADRPVGSAVRCQEK
jgi:hypothetical protein